MADTTELDSVDRALLRELQNDARQTNKALAEKVGVAASTCLERVRKKQVDHGRAMIHSPHTSMIVDLDAEAVRPGESSCIGSGR